MVGHPLSKSVMRGVWSLGNDNLTKSTDHCQNTHSTEVWQVHLITATGLRSSRQAQKQLWNGQFRKWAQAVKRLNLAPSYGWLVPHYLGQDGSTVTHKRCPEKLSLGHRNTQSMQERGGDMAQGWGIPNHGPWLFWHGKIRTTVGLVRSRERSQVASFVVPCCFKVSNDRCPWWFVHQ